MLRFEDLIVGVTEAIIPCQPDYFGIVSEIHTKERRFTVHWKLLGRWTHYSSYPENALNNDYFMFTNPNSIKSFLMNGTPVDLNKVFP